MSEKPDTVHGRLMESIHITGYSFERAMKGLKWLLEDDRWKECGDGYERIDDFVNTLKLGQFRIAMDERKEITIMLAEKKATQRVIAGALGVGQATVGRDLEIEPHGSGVIERSDTEEAGEIIEPHGSPSPVVLAKGGEEAAAILDKQPSVHFSSATNEWATPQNIIDLVVSLFGTIDLDPCSDGHSIPALSRYTQGDGGLLKEWRGRVYMNPPYGSEIVKWVSKLVVEYSCGNTSEAIALVPSRTDTQWFYSLRDFPRCFIRGRLKFGGHDNSAPFPSMAVYLGERAEDFVSIFENLGDIYVRHE